SPRIFLKTEGGSPSKPRPASSLRLAIVLVICNNCQKQVLRHSAPRQPPGVMKRAADVHKRRQYAGIKLMVRVLACPSCWEKQAFGQSHLSHDRGESLWNRCTVCCDIKFDTILADRNPFQKNGRALLTL